MTSSLRRPTLCPMTPLAAIVLALGSLAPAQEPPGRPAAGLEGPGGGAEVPRAPVRLDRLTSESWNTAGAAIPDVALPRIDGGGVVDLASLRGRKLLLIHFASW